MSAGDSACHVHERSELNVAGLPGLEPGRGVLGPHDTIHHSPILVQSNFITQVLC